MRRLWGVLAAELILVFFLCFGCAGFESLAAGDGGVSWQDENAQAEAAVSANGPGPDGTGWGSWR